MYCMGWPHQEPNVRHPIIINHLETSIIREDNILLVLGWVGFCCGGGGCWATNILSLYGRYRGVPLEKRLL